MAQICCDKKARDVISIDLSGLTEICDYFVICTAATDIQARAIADAVNEAFDGKRIKDRQIAGVAKGEWTLLDYGDVVAHIMRDEARARYKLEEFWGKGKLEHFE